VAHVLLAVCGVAANLLSSGPHAEAADADVWVVSTRCLGGTCGFPEKPGFTVEQLVPNDCGMRRWQQADLAAMLADSSRPLAIFIHGNRYDAASAKQHGLALARRLSRFSPTDVPARTVIFSWPSQKQGCLLADGRTKYQRCYTDAHYLAALLAQVDPAQPVALVGYSFGALITLEAFEDLCGPEGARPCGAGSLHCRPGPMHVVLVAPAVRCDALAPCGPYRDSLACVDRLTVIINSRDDALRFFPLLDPRLDLPALGSVGMPRRWAGEGTAFRMTDAASIVGRQHSLNGYLESATLSALIATAAVSGL
jgi:pimeloyl-ACP methyl ester carboxylesterase